MNPPLLYEENVIHKNPLATLPVFIYHSDDCLDKITLESYIKNVSQFVLDETKMKRNQLKKNSALKVFEISLGVLRENFLLKTSKDSKWRWRNNSNRRKTYFGETLIYCLALSLTYHFKYNTTSYISTREYFEGNIFMSYKVKKGKRTSLGNAYFYLSSCFCSFCNHLTKISGEDCFLIPRLDYKTFIKKYGDILSLHFRGDAKEKPIWRILIDALAVIHEEDVLVKQEGFSSFNHIDYRGLTVTASKQAIYSFFQRYLFLFDVEIIQDNGTEFFYVDKLAHWDLSVAPLEFAKIKA